MWQLFLANSVYGELCNWNYGGYFGSNVAIRDYHIVHVYAAYMLCLTGRVQMLDVRKCYPKKATSCSTLTQLQSTLNSIFVFCQHTGSFLICRFIFLWDLKFNIQVDGK